MVILYNRLIDRTCEMVLGLSKFCGAKNVLFSFRLNQFFRKSESHFSFNSYHVRLNFRKVSDRHRQNCNRLPNSSFGRTKIEIGCMQHHAISAAEHLHRAELVVFTQYQFCTFRNDRDKNWIGKQSRLSLRSKQRRTRNRPKTTSEIFRKHG